MLNGVKPSVPNVSPVQPGKRKAPERTGAFILGTPASQPVTTPQAVRFGAMTPSGKGAMAIGAFFLGTMMTLLPAMANPPVAKEKTDVPGATKSPAESEKLLAKFDGIKANKEYGYESISVKQSKEIRPLFEATTKLIQSDQPIPLDDLKRFSIIASNRFHLYLPSQDNKEESKLALEYHLSRIDLQGALLKRFRKTPPKNDEEKRLIEGLRQDLCMNLKGNYYYAGANTEITRHAAKTFRESVLHGLPLPDLSKEVRILVDEARPQMYDESGQGPPSDVVLQILADSREDFAKVVQETTKTITTQPIAKRQNLLPALHEFSGMMREIASTGDDAILDEAPAKAYRKMVQETLDPAILPCIRTIMFAPDNTLQERIAMGKLLGSGVMGEDIAEKTTKQIQRWGLHLPDALINAPLVDMAAARKDWEAVKADPKADPMRFQNCPYGEEIGPFSTMLLDLMRTTTLIDHKVPMRLLNTHYREVEENPQPLRTGKKSAPTVMLVALLTLSEKDDLTQPMIGTMLYFYQESMIRDFYRRGQPVMPEMWGEHAASFIAVTGGMERSVTDEERISSRARLLKAVLLTGHKRTEKFLGKDEVRTMPGIFDMYRKHLETRYLLDDCKLTALFDQDPKKRKAAEAEADEILKTKDAQATVEKRFQEGKTQFIQGFQATARELQLENPDAILVQMGFLEPPAKKGP